MNRASLRKVLITLICVFALIAVLLAALAVYLTLREEAPGETTAPTVSATVPTEAPQETTASPAETTVPTTAPVIQTEPQTQHYTLSFAGDCTFGNRKGKTGKSTFIGTVGEDYAYPFADVLEYFANDDCTFVNLENPLTDGGTPDTKKEFVFRGPTSYVNILTEGSVEFANVVNNHTLDYGDVGYEDTLKTLDSAGIYYGEMEKPMLFTTESGLTIGVYADIDPQNTKGLATNIKALRDQGAEIVVVSLHWGYEYYYKHNATQQKIARHAIESGADIVYGHHPHVLQKIEQYKDGYIFYSLGNFSFGGNPNPPDKETAILQVQVVRETDGKVHLGELNIIPCYVSGAGNVGNDYQPCPIDPVADEAAYKRVLRKLDGTHNVNKLVVSYRENTTDETTDNTTDSTDSTKPSGGDSSGGESSGGESSGGESSGGETSGGESSGGESSGGESSGGESSGGESSGDESSGGES